MAEKLTTENRIDMVVEAFLTRTSVTDVSKATGIPRATIYSLMKRPEFSEKMAEARQRSMDRAITYMQGNLVECSEVLMDIIRDKNNSPQVRINAINAIFQNCKGLSSDGSTLTEMAVTIVDNI